MCRGGLLACVYFEFIMFIVSFRSPVSCHNYELVTSV